MLSRNGKLVGDAESFVSFLGLDADAAIDDILKMQNIGEFDGDERETYKVLSHLLTSCSFTFIMKDKYAAGTIPTEFGLMGSMTSLSLCEFRSNSWGTSRQNGSPLWSRSGTYSHTQFICFRFNRLHLIRAK